MPKKRKRYPLEYRRRMVELARSGRSPEALAREFEPSAPTIRSWVRQADLDEGRRDDGTTTRERDELRRLKRENKQLRLERDIIIKSRGLVRPPERVRVREGAPGRVPRARDVPRPRSLPERLLRVAEATAFRRARCATTCCASWCAAAGKRAAGRTGGRASTPTSSLGRARRSEARRPPHARGGHRGREPPPPCSRVSDEPSLPTAARQRRRKRLE